MKVFAKAIAHLIVFCTLIIFITLPVNKYDWMKEMTNPSMSIPHDNAGNRAIFTFLFLVVSVLIELIIVVKVKNKNEKLWSIALILTLIIIWLTKFFR